MLTYYFEIMYCEKHYTYKCELNFIELIDGQNGTSWRKCDIFKCNYLTFTRFECTYFRTHWCHKNLCPSSFRSLQLFTTDFITSVSAVDSLNSSVHYRSASLLNPAGHYYSDPALSGKSLRIVELMPQFHNAEQSHYSQQDW